VLVGSTLLLFLVVSALVAFRAWPGSGIADAVGDLVVKDSRPALTVAGPSQVALDAAPAAAAVGAAAVPAAATAAAPAGEAVTGSAPETTGPAGDGTPQIVTGPGSVTERPQSGASAAQPPQGGGSTQGGAPASGLGGVTNGAGDTTQGLTDGLGQTVGGVNPELGKTVTDTGEALSDLVRGLGGE
jgi:hypothetical protein